MSEPSWFLTGKAGRERFQQEDALRAVTKNIEYIPRFKLSYGESARVVLLDHPETWLFEHRLYNGKYSNYFTCIKERATCPLCITGNNPYLAVVCTAIDTRTITTQKGTELKNRKVLLVFKGNKVLKTLEKQFFQPGIDLTHRVLTIERDTDSKAPNCGEFFTLGKKVPIEKIASLAGADVKGPDYIKPFNYREILAPKTGAELRAIAGLGNPVGSGDDGVIIPNAAPIMESNDLDDYLGDDDTVSPDIKFESKEEVLPVQEEMFPVTKEETKPPNISDLTDEDDDLI